MSMITSVSPVVTFFTKPVVALGFATLTHLFQRAMGEMPSSASNSASIPYPTALANESLPVQLLDQLQKLGFSDGLFFEQKLSFETFPRPAEKLSQGIDLWKKLGVDLSFKNPSDLSLEFTLQFTKFPLSNSPSYYAGCSFMNAAKLLQETAHGPKNEVAELYSRAIEQFEKISIKSTALQEKIAETHGIRSDLLQTAEAREGAYQAYFTLAQMQGVSGMPGWYRFSISDAARRDAVDCFLKAAKFAPSAKQRYECFSKAVDIGDQSSCFEKGFLEELKKQRDEAWKEHCAQSSLVTRLIECVYYRSDK